MAGYDWEISKLEERLMKYPSICPVCNEEMKMGYMKGSFIRWVSFEEERPFIDYWLAPSPYFIPSYLCEHCNLIVGQTKTKSRVKEINKINKKINNFDNCPYCNSKFSSGYICRGGRGLFLWGKEKRFYNDENIYLLNFFSLKAKSRRLPTRLCDNCGIFFSKFKLEEVKRKVRREKIALAILIIVLVLIQIYMLLTF